jgi:ABC-type multidrug transport system fused ATPase/permease subunit
LFFVFRRYAELARLQALHEKKQESAGGVKHLASEVDPDVAAAHKADMEAAQTAAVAAVAKAKEAAKTPEDIAAGIAKKKEEAKALQLNMAKWNQVLLAMTFTNGLEWFKLVMACLMACINGATMPVFSIIFTEMLTIFFSCFPVPLGVPLPASTENFLTACSGATGNPLWALGVGANQSIFTYYGCVQDDLLELGNNYLTALDNNETKAAFALLCYKALDGCEFPSAECRATDCDALAECNAALLDRGSVISGYFVVIGVAALIGVLFQTWLFGDIGAALTRRIREASFRTLLRQHIGYFDKEEHSTGALTTKLSHDASLVEAAVGKNIGSYVQNACTVVVALIIAFIAGYELTLLLLGLLPFMVIGNVIETRSYMTEVHQASADEARAGQIVSESVRGVRTVASFGIEPRILGIYDKLMRRSYDSALGTGACGGMAYGYSQFIMFAIYCCGFLFAGWLIREGLYTADQVMRVFFVMLLSAFAIGQAVGFNADVSKGQQAIPSIFSIIDAQTETDPTSTDGIVVSEPVATGVKGRIEFRDVKFAYPERKGLVLKGISFTVEPGQTVALVGSSGSGKSTAFALLQRFYDLPEGSGEILIDGRPIREYNLRTLRNILGTVEQEPRLFSGSVRHNVLFGTRKEYQDLLVGTGNPADAAAAAQLNSTVTRVAAGEDLEAAGETEKQETDRRVRETLALANATFVEALPDGLETPVGEAGKGQLSGGQKQRIAIARALMKDAPIMLLDEATSALDSESEKLVQEALTRIMRERTSLVIAHRLSTIQDADKIIVMQQGVIVETGTHQELLQAEGVYAELCREQSMATA